MIYNIKKSGILLFKALILVALMLLPMTAVMAANALQNHPSPYLAMHGDDPVQWRSWGEEALAEAKRDNKLLFVSSGYFSCHWCHVMQRESYQNAEVAAILNKWFIPVKIDRELQPALDDYLIGFVELTQGQAGWPLNVFLTPDGYPLVGMTYVPMENFVVILEKLSSKWTEERAQLQVQAQQAFKAMSADMLSPIKRRDFNQADAIRKFVDFAMNYGDDLQGGFGAQNRFPLAPQLQLLVDIQKRTPNVDIEKFLRLTLDQMAYIGLRDHLGGGFFRYTVDPGWKTPHYEKMLYSQAQLTSLYLKAAAVLDEPEYLAVAEDTLDFALSELRVEEGAFIASLSAVDADGNEGGSYLWNRRQLKQVLEPDQLELAARYWAFEFDDSSDAQALPFRGEDIASIATDIKRPVVEVKHDMRTIRQQLLADRENRAAPRDTKLLAAWNGLMLTALSEAAAILNRDDYKEAAGKLAAWLMTLWDGENLARSRSGSQTVGDASLEDYAYVAEGLQHWARLSGDAKAAAVAAKMIDSAWKKFFNDHGWRLGENMLIPGLNGEPALQDGPMPASSAVLMSISPRLSTRYQQALVLSEDAVALAPFWTPGHLWLLSQSDRKSEKEGKQ